MYIEREKMIVKLRLLLDYQCYPVWLYDENGRIVDTLLPEELRNDKELDKKFDDLQARYDNLFINNEREFSFVGFRSEEERKRFFDDWNTAAEELKAKTGGKYEIVDDVKLSGI